MNAPCDVNPCYDCLRAKGVTTPKRCDFRGRLRFPPDGRFLLRMQKGDDGEGKVVTRDTGEAGEQVE